MVSPIAQNHETGDLYAEQLKRSVVKRSVEQRNNSGVKESSSVTNNLNWAQVKGIRRLQEVDKNWSFDLVGIRTNDFLFNSAVVYRSE